MIVLYLALSGPSKDPVVVTMFVHGPFGGLGRPPTAFPGSPQTCSWRLACSSLQENVFCFVLFLLCRKMLIKESSLPETKGVLGVFLPGPHHPRTYEGLAQNPTDQAFSLSQDSES